MREPFVSVVIPVFNEEENIVPLASALRDVLAAQGGEYELIFVDDGSKDRSLYVLRALARDEPRVSYIRFSRNFGHQAALRAGIEAASGDCVVMMDGDFQHPPALLPALIAEFKKGFDIVSTKRNGAADGNKNRLPFIKRITSRLFYAIVNTLGDIKIEPGAADFRLISKKTKDALFAMKEQNLFLRGALPWLGLPSSEIAYSPEARRSGATKYTFSKMAALALDGITSFSTKPLRLTAFAGLAIAGAGFIYVLYAFFLRLFSNKTVEGWTSLLISVLIIGGIQLLSLGIIGEYLGKLFMEAKGRPAFIVEERSPRKTESGRESRP